MSVPQPPGVNPTSQKSTTLQPTLTNDFWDNFVFADTNFNVINWLYNNPLEWLKTYSLSENHVIRIENNVPVVDNQAPRNGGILNFDKVMDPLLQFDKVIGNIPILNISLTLNMAIADGLMGVWDIIASIPLSIIRPFEGQLSL